MRSLGAALACCDTPAPAHLAGAAHMLNICWGAQRPALCQSDRSLVHKQYRSRSGSDLSLYVVGCDVGCPCHDGDRRLFERRGRRARDERRPWLYLAGCIAVRGTLTWHFWDALRFVLVVERVVLGARRTSTRPCEEVCSASRAARAGTT